MRFLDWKVWDRLDAVDRRLGLRGDQPPDEQARMTRRLLSVMARLAGFLLTIRGAMWDRVAQLFHRGDAPTGRQAVAEAIGPFKQRGGALEQERRRFESQVRGHTYPDE